MTFNADALSIEWMVLPSNRVRRARIDYRAYAVHDVSESAMSTAHDAAEIYARVEQLLRRQIRDEVLGPQPRWTDKTPDVPGWYWVKDVMLLNRHWFTPGEGVHLVKADINRDGDIVFRSRAFFASENVKFYAGELAGFWQPATVPE